MTQKPENPQAFPNAGTERGMTLRDYFAGQALMGIVSNLEIDVADVSNQIADKAYACADAMLLERSYKK